MEALCQLSYGPEAISPYQSLISGVKLSLDVCLQWIAVLDLRAGSYVMGQTRYDRSYGRRCSCYSTR